VSAQRSALLWPEVDEKFSLQPVTVILRLRRSQSESVTMTPQLAEGLEKIGRAPAKSHTKRTLDRNQRATVRTPECRTVNR
jgi:hypothetical protein